MSQSADLIATRPCWLSESCVRVMKLPKELPLKEGVERHTLQLLRGIEADDLPVPGVWSTSQGCVHLRWANGLRTLHICVTGPGSYRVGRSRAGRRLAVLEVTRDRILVIRQMVEWLFPAANNSPVQKIEGWR